MSAIPAHLSLQFFPPNGASTDELRKQPDRTGPKAVEGTAYQSKTIYCADDRDQALSRPLQPGNRIRRIHARRTGLVVRVHDDLGHVIADYADDAEVIELARALEGVSASILARRYCPGLNAASYDVFRRYGMKGGVQ